MPAIGFARRAPCDTVSGASDARGIAASVIPVGRIGTPEDMAHAIAFFLDRRSAFVTGQALMVCGGSSLGAREHHAPAPER